MDQVRSALIDTAAQTVTTDDTPSPNAIPVDVQEVGGGLLNAGAAIAATVTSSPATLSFGAIQGVLPAAKTLTLTNTGSSAVSLTVAAVQNVTGANISITPSSVSLAPGASTQVKVQLTGSVPTYGEYSGGITIQGSGVSLRVPYLYFVPDGAQASAPDLVSLNGDGFDGTVGQGISFGILAFMVTDDYGIPIAGVPVTWSADSGGSFNYEDSKTNAYGIAIAEPVLGSQPGNYSFTANVPSLNLSYSFTGIARPAPTIRAQLPVENAASFGGGGIAPGSYIAIYGSGLADVTDLSFTPRLPLGLGMAQEGFGTFVSFDVPSAGISVPGHLTYISPTQVNVQVPWELQGQSSVQMKVTIDYSTSQVITVPVVEYSPAFFTYGANQVDAVDTNQKVVGPNNPVMHGKAVQLFANGLGPVTNQPVSGDPATNSPYSYTTSVPVVKINGEQCQVIYNGLEPGYAGLYQVNVYVPDDLKPGSYPITIAMGDQTSPAAQIQVQ